MKRPGYDHLLKLIIIGDSSVGKTCILLRFSEDNFPTAHMPTIGKPTSLNLDLKSTEIKSGGFLMKLSPLDSHQPRREWSNPAFDVNLG